MSTWNPIRASGRFWHRFGPYLEKLEDAILRVSGGRHPLDVAFATEEEDSKPWQRPSPMPARITGPLPKTLTLVLANQIFIAKADLPQPLANRLIRIAAFQNPEFYKAQAMRLPVWNKPRIIGCAENHPRYIGLPCGCLDAVLDLLKENDIRPQLQDERLPGRKVTAKFTGTLRKDQKTAVREMLKHEVGVLCAPTAFGKTVTAAALIARRKVSTLVLVHRTELLRQWQERLNGFLELPKGWTGRTSHLPLLREELGNEVEHCFVLHGRLSKKQRTAVFAELDELDESAPRVLLATGRLIGEGFDHPPLDTLVLAMPISWKGTLQQYAGRLHRQHADKQDVRIYDYAETDQPQLARMWKKRQRGYRAMGYRIKDP